MVVGPTIDGSSWHNRQSASVKWAYSVSGTPMIWLTGGRFGGTFAHTSNATASIMVIAIVRLKTFFFFIVSPPSSILHKKASYQY
jgi:hypothetical protein